MGVSDGVGQGDRNRGYAEPGIGRVPEAELRAATN